MQHELEIEFEDVMSRKLGKNWVEGFEFLRLSGYAPYAQWNLDNPDGMSDFLKHYPEFGRHLKRNETTGQPIRYSK